MPYSTLIPCREAQAHLDDARWRFIDCRFDLMQPQWGEGQYAAGHLPGALYAHLDRDLSAPVNPASGRHPLPAVAKLEQTFAAWGINAGTQVVAYDAGNGMFASRLWWLLRWLGHDAVAVLDGGWGAWQQAGLPTTTGITAATPAAFRATPRSEWVVNTEAIAARQGEGFVLLDARAPERYRGEVEPIDPVAGHIPGARNYPLTDNLADGRFKTASQLAKQLHRVLDDVKPDHVVHYCGSGVSACHNILAMEHAGLHGSRLYPGSWSEWIRDPRRAIAKG